MTLKQLQHSIGRVRAAIGRVLNPPARARWGVSHETPITALSHELVADLAGMVGHARRSEALIEHRYRVTLLHAYYTELHSLEARLPTPETLSAAAYGRALHLGLSLEEAEAARSRAYRDARHDARLRAA